ncbi:MAG TPA: hypothetical protein VLA49_03505 [Anaerolineales bacterium]|nr:hypothetical protein [Anaerolineales bacterium]
MKNQFWQLFFETSLTSQPYDLDNGVEFNHNQLNEQIERLGLTLTSEQRILSSIRSAYQNAGKYARELGVGLSVFIRIFIREKGGMSAQREDECGLIHPNLDLESSLSTSVPNISLTGNLPKDGEKARGGYFLLERYVDGQDPQSDPPLYLIELYFYYTRK